MQEIELLHRCIFSPFQYLNKMTFEDLKSIRNEFERSDLYRNAQTKMSLSGLFTAEIADYLFNAKKINFDAVPESDFQSFQKTSCADEIYKDNSMKILHGADANDIEYIFIRSNWFGRVKNSQFNLSGFFRNGNFWCGYCAVSDIMLLDEFTLGKIMGSIVEKNTNKANLSSVFNCFNDYVQYCQKKYGESPTYEVMSLGGYDHAPTVTIRISSPDGTFITKGCNKKEAANEWAKKRNR